MTVASRLSAKDLSVSFAATPVLDRLLSTDVDALRDSTNLLLDQFPGLTAIVATGGAVVGPADYDVIEDAD